MAYAHVNSDFVVPGRRQAGIQTRTLDDALLARIAEGDRQAMQLLFLRHNVRVFRFVLGKVKDRTIAEDVVADIFLEVWRSSHRFEARASVSTWLLAIARHKAISALRGRCAHDEIDNYLAVEDSSGSPYITAEIRDRDARLRECISKLSPNHREVLDLVYYQEKPIETVASIMGIPLNTVKTRMFHARKQLTLLLRKAGINETAVSQPGI
jgi:RNA polymerase sigma-70 factor, ECF subfamily